MSEAAERLGISDRRVRQLIDEGALTATQTTAGWLVALADVQARSLTKHSAGRPPNAGTAWAVLEELAMVTPSLFDDWLRNAYPQRLADLVGPAVIADRPNRFGADVNLPEEPLNPAVELWLSQINAFPWGHSAFVDRTALHLLGVRRQGNAADATSRGVARRARRLLSRLADPRTNPGAWTAALRGRADTIYMWTDLSARKRLIDAPDVLIAGVHAAVRAGVHLADEPDDVLDVYVTASDLDPVMKRHRLQRIDAPDATLRLHVVPDAAFRHYDRTRPPTDTASTWRRLRDVTAAIDLLERRDPREQRAGLVLLAPRAAVACAAARASTPLSADRPAV